MKKMLSSLLTTIVTLSTLSVLAEAPTPVPVPVPVPVAAQNSDDTALVNDDQSAQPLNSALGLKDDSRIQFNGFISSGGVQTNAKNNAHYNIAEHGSVTSTMDFNPLTVVGIQMNAKITDKFTGIAQLVASGDDTNGNDAYDLSNSWGLIRYQANDHMQINVGRIRLPVFLNSDTIQVGYSYPTQFLPNEVYRLVPFYNMNGINTVLSRSLGKGDWTMSLQPFYGNNKSQYDTYFKGGSPSPSFALTYKEDDMIGGVATLSNDNITLMGSYTHLKLSENNSTTDPTSYTDKKAASFYDLGMKANIKQMFVMTEYAHRNMPTGDADLTGYYATLGAHIKKALPTITYAHIKTDNQSDLTSNNDELPVAQESVTGAIAYYVNDNIDIKASISDIKPLDGTWGLFSADPGKSHVLMYGLGIDAIF